eukprot:SAG11_NODE_18807_length_481_cov_0.471204_1_plen_86_part_10
MGKGIQPGNSIGKCISLNRCFLHQACPPPDEQLAATQPLTPLEMTAERSATAVGGLDGSVHLAHAKSLSGPWTLQPGDQPVAEKAV